MRTIFLVLLLAAASASAAPPAAHVAVISVDGLGASEMSGKPSCLAAGSTIRRLARAGAWSLGVTGVLPTITYPSHATIVTGANPADHGVIDNGEGGKWFSQRSKIALPTLWDAARAAGRSVAIVTWPSTYGAAADWLIPEDLNNFAVATEDIRKGSTPGLFDALAGATVKPALMPFVHGDAGQPLDEMTARFAIEVVRRHRPALLLTHFLDYDHRMHKQPFSPEACQSLERTDEWIRQLVEAYRAAGILERTTFFIVSDHGFLPVRKFIGVHGLINDAGWKALEPAQDAAAAFKFMVAGGSAAFYPGGVTPERMRELVPQLKEAILKRHGNKVRWIEPAKARAMGGFPDAAFVLCARRGYSFTVFKSHDQVLGDIPSIGGMHGYCPDDARMDALFIASGHGVRAAGAVAKMPMVDMGPTIASFVGVELAKAAGRDRSSAFRARSSAGRARGR